MKTYTQAEFDAATAQKDREIERLKLMEHVAKVANEDLAKRIAELSIQHGACSVCGFVAWKEYEEVQICQFCVQAERIAQLEAGGCARDQGTTQFCAEAVTLQKRFAELEATTEQFADELTKRHQHIGQLEALLDKVPHLEFEEFQRQWEALKKQ